MAGASKKIISVEYEVFGRVQGVFFRKYTQETATKLGLVGWVKNTTAGTVTGIIQGPGDKILAMREWLATTGSPMSSVSKCEFKDQRTIDNVQFNKFSVKGGW